MLLNCGVGEDLRVPWTARRSNQSILKEISPEYSLEGLMLKLQYFHHLTRRTVSLENPLKLGKIKGRRRRGRQRMRWLDASHTQSTWVWVNSGRWQCTGRPGVLQSMGLQRVGHDRATELNWWLTEGRRPSEVMEIKLHMMTPMPCFQSPVKGKGDGDQWTWDLTEGKASSCCVTFNTHYRYRKCTLSRDTH